MKFWESNHQSVQEGDMQFIALYKFYYQDLYAYGVSLGFNTEDVKDAIQEVYLKLYFNERLCIDEKKIKFYLLRSVRNQLIDWERTKKDTSSASTYDVEDRSDLDWPEQTWNFTCSTTETSTWAEGGRKFGELVEKATGGNVRNLMMRTDKLARHGIFFPDTAAGLEAFLRKGGAL